MEDDFIDGCEVDFVNDADTTSDEDIDALVMFADVWGDPAAVWIRRLEMMELVGYV